MPSIFNITLDRPSNSYTVTISQVSQTITSTITRPVQNITATVTRNGPRGTGWVTGSGAPSDGTGSNGDMYMDTAASAYYGPKASGTWAGTGPTSIQGPTGPAGADGADGATGPAGADGTDGVDGADGATGPAGADGTDGTDGADGSDGADGAGWLSGSGAPSDGNGSDGDFYLDTAASAYYGPKAAGTWTGTGPNSLLPSDPKKYPGLSLLVIDGVTLATGNEVGGAPCFLVGAELNGFELSAVGVRIGAAGTTGTHDYQLRRVRSATSQDLLTTKITIDSTETDSSTAAAAPVIDTASSRNILNTGDIWYLDCDAVATTPGEGHLIFYFTLLEF